jgi:hypothetical protein
MLHGHGVMCVAQAQARTSISVQEVTGITPYFPILQYWNPPHTGDRILTKMFRSQTKLNSVQDELPTSTKKSRT